MNSVTGLAPIGLMGAGPQSALDHLLESPAAKIAALNAKADEDQTATRVLNAELDQFDASHADIGGYLLGLWGLPQELIEAM